MYNPRFSIHFEKQLRMERNRHGKVLVRQIRKIIFEVRYINKDEAHFVSLYWCSCNKSNQMTSFSIVFFALFSAYIAVFSSPGRLMNI